MNERIEALKKLATKEVWGNNPHNGSPEFDGYELDADMFAELIVEKCAGIIESQDVDPSFKLRMSWAVKKHFGVK